MATYVGQFSRTSHLTDYSSAEGNYTPDAHHRNPSRIIDLRHNVMPRDANRCCLMLCHAWEAGAGNSKKVACPEK